MDETSTKVDELLSGYLDGELTQQDRQRVRLRLENCPRYAQRLRELESISASLGKLRVDSAEENRQQWRKVMDNAFDRTAQGVGWLLVIGAALVIVGYGAYEFVLADWEPPLVKWAVAALYVGFAVLLLTVLRQRLIARRKDRYKDVEI